MPFDRKVAPAHARLEKAILSVLNYALAFAECSPTETYARIFRQMWTLGVVHVVLVVS